MSGISSVWLATPVPRASPVVVRGFPPEVAALQVVWMGFPPEVAALQVVWIVLAVIEHPLDYTVVYSTFTADSEGR